MCIIVSFCCSLLSTVYSPLFCAYQCTRSSMGLPRAAVAQGWLFQHEPSEDCCLSEVSLFCMECRLPGACPLLCTSKCFCPTCLPEEHLLGVSSHLLPSSSWYQPPPTQATPQSLAIPTLPGVASVVCQAKHNRLVLEAIVNRSFYLTDMCLECAAVH